LQATFVSTFAAFVSASAFISAFAFVAAFAFAFAFAFALFVIFAFAFVAFVFFVVDFVSYEKKKNSRRFALSSTSSIYQMFRTIKTTHDL
jgi:membrane protein implicated in regulation of membrane protease activity